MADPARNASRLPGIVLGLGMGGFIDGFLLHQVFQLHAMLSGRIPLDSMESMQTNMVADGLFHLAVWLVTLVGIFLLVKSFERHRSEGPSARALAGWMLFGWGLFNVVEGLISHQILGLHHVVERLGLSIWDWLFPASGLALMVVGWIVARRGGSVGPTPTGWRSSRRVLPAARPADAHFCTGPCKNVRAPEGIRRVRRPGNPGPIRREAGKNPCAT